VLNPKQQRFVAEYLIDLNATQAAIRAGYSKKTAEQQGNRLLGKAQIQAAVSAGKQRQLTHADLSAVRVLEELRRLAFSDVRELFTEQGDLKPLRDLTPEQSAAIASVEVLIKNAKAGDGQTDTIHKIRLWDKSKTLDTLAKHFNLLTEQVQHAGTVDFRWLTRDEQL
jgi:phage terminase small subunit